MIWADAGSSRKVATLRNLGIVVLLSLVLGFELSLLLEGSCYLWAKFGIE